MRKFLWTSTISVNLLILRCVGLWPEDSDSGKFYTVYAAFVATVIILGHNATQFVNIFFVYNNLEALIATLFILTTNILVIIKMCFFLRNLKVIKQLLRILNSSQFLPKVDQLQLLQPSLKLWKMAYTVYSTIVCINLILWTIAPFLNQDQKLPFFAWYPFSVDKSPNYQIVYFYQSTCIWYITAANINMDSLIYALLIYIWSQCDILCDNLSQLEGDHIMFNQKLIRCIKHHKNINRFAKTINDIFDIVILGQFATSTLVLASSLFRLSLSNSLSITAFTNLNYLIGISTQLFIYCWFGNEVESKSSHISYAIYESNWFEQPIETKRNMLIFGARCQKPVKITALNLFALSLNTFVNILRTAWSYFAVLHNVNDV